MPRQVKYKKVAIWEETHEILKLLGEYWGLKLTELVHELALDEMTKICLTYGNGKKIKEVEVLRDDIVHRKVDVKLVLDDGSEKIVTVPYVSDHGRPVIKLLEKCKEILE